MSAFQDIIPPMRADRLLSILMLLQTRRRMTARQLAAELEVSRRTIYRDLVALNAAGIPIYTEDGCHGGISLVESYRTDLTGLSPEEGRALAMLEVPEPLARLGLGSQLKAALLKVAAALPATSQQARLLARQRIHLDAAWWFQPDEAAPHLQTLYQAVWQERKLRLLYRSHFDTEVELLISPYGLVAKANTWYLVGAVEERLRALRVSRIEQVAVLDEVFAPSPDFDLAAFWKQWREVFEKNRPSYPVLARLSPELVRHLPRLFGHQAKDILASDSPPDESGWVTATLEFEHLEAARARLLSLGRSVEVLEPLALRLSLIDFAQQIVELYSHSSVV